MADAVVLDVQERDTKKNVGTGSRASRKLRKQGRVPAILYGHKQDPQPISLSQDDIKLLLKKRSHLVQLRVGGASEMTLIRDVQWNYLGSEIIHLDFIRVSAQETVTTTVALKLHGNAPGLSQGGVLEQPIHEIEIQCLATAIPDTIRVEVGELGVDASVHLRDLTLPEGVTTSLDPETVLVHIVSKASILAADEAATAEAAGPIPTAPVPEDEGAEGAEKPQGDQPKDKDKAPE